MTRTRWWTAGAVLAMAVLVALGWFLGVDPRLTEARTAEDDLAGVQIQNASYEQKLVELKEIDSNLSDLTKELDALSAAIPSDAQVSTLLGQLNSLAADSGVVLTSITAGVPQRFGAEDETTAAAAPAPAPAEGEAAAETPTTEAPTTEAPAAPVAADNFVSVPVSVEFTGDRGALLAFIEKVQYGTRLFLVDALDITYDASGGIVKIDGFVYVLTEAPAAADTATSEEG